MYVNETALFRFSFSVNPVFAQQSIGKSISLQTFSFCFSPAITRTLPSDSLQLPYLIHRFVVVPSPEMNVPRALKNYPINIKLSNKFERDQVCMFSVWRGALFMVSCCKSPKRTPHKEKGKFLGCQDVRDAAEGNFQYVSFAK